MSNEKMIALDPAVGSDFNEALAAVTPCHVSRPDVPRILWECRAAIPTLQ